MSNINQNSLMKGIKIRTSKKEFLIGPSTKGGLITLIISLKKDETIKLNVVGLESETDISQIWIDKVLDLDESLDIQVVEIEHNSDITPPIHIRHNDSENFVNSEKLKYFYKLKEELEDKGML
jgi:hypothetical protein